MITTGICAIARRPTPIGSAPPRRTCSRTSSSIARSFRRARSSRLIAAREAVFLRGYLDAAEQSRRSRAMGRTGSAEGRRDGGPRLVRSRAFGSTADAGIGGLWRADVEAGIGRVLRSRLAVLDILQEVHRLVTHLERTLADLPGGEALLHQLDLHRQRVGDHESESARGDLVLVLRRDPFVGVGQELRETAGRGEGVEIGIFG